jgi:mRNA interferase MazF
VSNYIPEEGDLVWLNFTPQAGREQAGRRPALVLTPSAYNSKSGLMIACPVTSRVKGYPFEVALPASTAIQGAVLADHLRSLDWSSRDATLIEPAPEEVMSGVLARLQALLQL